MTKGLVSIVLPIYNVENYLERCLKSVLNQTYKNMEIILVDDGSTDSCPKICDKWCQTDKRCKVIHKKNNGLGMARNTGIENANGEYICFFDSDDYIVPDTIEKAMAAAYKEKAEIVLFGYSHIAANGKCVKSIIPSPAKNVYAGAEVQELFLPDLIAPNPTTGETANILMSACTSLFSMDLIKETCWRFVSERDIIAEDVYSLLFLYKHVKKLVILPESLYCYCWNASSLTHTYRRDRYEKIRYFHEQCLNAQKQLSYSNEVAKRLTEPYISFTIAAMNMIVQTNHPPKEQVTELKCIIEDTHLQQTLREIDLHRAPLKRKAFLYALKRRMCIVCYILLKMNPAFLKRRFKSFIIIFNKTSAN